MFNSKREYHLAGNCKEGLKLYLIMYSLFKDDTITYENLKEYLLERATSNYLDFNPLFQISQSYIFWNSIGFNYSLEIG